jgi:D-alanyl-D-alanine dipeptidase
VTHTRTDEALRIAFWRDSMEQGRRFMERMMEYPVRESHEPLASIEDAAASADVEMEFSASPIVDDIPRIFDIRESLIEPLIAVAREMNERGWLLKIEDSFRTAEMQRKLARKASIFDLILRKVMWETGAPNPDPALVMRRASTLVAQYPKVAGHMSGCAIDISVFDRDTRAEIDRGRPYLEMSELTPMASPFVSPEALRNRAMITVLMEKHGFMAYPSEFWHYSQGDVFAEHLASTGKPGRFAAVTRDPSNRSIEPVADLEAPLHAPEDIRLEIDNAHRRARGQ